MGWQLKLLFGRHYSHRYVFLVRLYQVFWTSQQAAAQHYIQAFENSYPGKHISIGSMKETFNRRGQTRALIVQTGSTLLSSVMDQLTHLVCIDPDFKKMIMSSDSIEYQLMNSVNHDLYMLESCTSATQDSHNKSLELHLHELLKVTQENTVKLNTKESNLFPDQGPVSSHAIQKENS